METGAVFVLAGGGWVVTQAYVTQIGVEVWSGDNAALRVTQAGIEVWAADIPALRVTQIGAEIWAADRAALRVTQAGVEIWAGALAGFRVTQIGLEVWASVEKAQHFTPVPPDEVQHKIHLDVDIDRLH